MYKVYLLNKCNNKYSINIYLITIDNENIFNLDEC